MKPIIPTTKSIFRSPAIELVLAVASIWCFWLAVPARAVSQASEPKNEVPVSVRVLPSFSVSGVITYELAPGVGRRPPTTNQFLVEKSNASWKITTKSTSATSALDSIIAECDGNETRTIYIPKSGPHQTLVVEPGTQPSVKNANGIPQLWLQFIGGEILSATRTNLAIPIWIASPNVPKLTNCLVPISYEWKQSPQFLATISYFQTGFFLDEADGKLITFPWPAPYERGFKGAEQRVTQWTNILGYSVPKAFVYNAYRPKDKGANSNDLTSVLTITANIDAFMTDNIPELKPTAFARNVAVADHRSAAVLPGGASYVLRGKSQLPETNSQYFKTTVQRKTAIQMKKHLSDEKEINTRSIYARTFFICLLIAAGCMFLIFFRKLKQNKTNK